MLKAIKIRLYPTDIQAAYINRQLGCCRFVYNSVLAWRKELYETERRTPSSSEISAFYLNLRNTHLFLREVHSKPQRQALMDLDKAYANFFRGLKNGQHVGFPKFKSKKEYNDSCRFPVDAFRGVKGNRISFTRELSDIHFKCSRRDEKYLNKWQKNVRSSTLRKTPSGRYYASILINCTDQEPKHVRTISPEKLKTKAVGVDMGIKSFAVTSDGEVFDGLSFKGLERQICKYQRQLSKTESDSKRHHRIRTQLAKKHEKVKNIRNEYHHKMVNALLKEYDLVCVESLNVSGMLKNHKLAKSIQSQGWSHFFSVLKYKSAWQGKEVCEVGRFYASSKQCHECGYKNSGLTLSDRVWVCPHCGAVVDRDLNAARNILDEGVRLYNEKIG